MSRALQWLAGLELRDPAWLWLALLIPAAWLAAGRRAAPALRFAPAPLAAACPPSWRTRLRWLPRALQLLGLLGLVVALARPVQRQPLPLEAEGIDILLCLDVSSSMAAKDLDERLSRLEVAQDSAARFVQGRAEDRIGLVRFARFPDVSCPLTLDHRALEGILRETRMVEPEGPEDATGIGTAVARAAQLLKDSQAESKVIILLTDGEENVATPQTPDEIGPRQAAALCRQLGVRVYAIAAGSGRRQADGQWLPLDTGPVQALAATTGGRFFEARDADAVQGVYAAIDRLEKTGFLEPRFRQQDVFAVFLAAALAALVAARLLRATLLEVLP
ncbi:MAG: VWA domain-containing protein [Planctomycetes bacterium]|nr:VWA domain-containing protein [Planctomycetota bacterium]